MNADLHAIGYYGLPYVKHNKVLAISDGGPAVWPTVFTVATEDYPVSRRLYLYTPAVPENRYTQDFIAFALGRAGQESVRKHKFVDLTVSAEEHRVEVALRTNQNYQVLYKYLTAVRGAKRLSASFRFKGETLELDSKGQHDLDRLVDFFVEQRPKEVILAGFSDRAENAARRAEGPVDRNYADNMELSYRRAEAVKEELSSRGIKTAALLCVGSELPTQSRAGRKTTGWKSGCGDGKLQHCWSLPASGLFWRQHSVSCGDTAVSLSADCLMNGRTCLLTPQPAPRRC